MKRVEGRRGLSLLEVILASAIFIGSMAVLGTMLDNGLLLVGVNERNTIALLRCESKMEEIVAGIQRIDESLPRQATAYVDDPHWRWTVLVATTPVEGLLRATVVVEYFEDPLSADADADHREVLTRLIADPSAFVTESEEASLGEGLLTIPEMLGLGPEEGSR